MRTGITGRPFVQHDVAIVGLEIRPDALQKRLRLAADIKIRGITLIVLALVQADIILFLVGLTDVVLVGRKYGNRSGMLPYTVLVDAEGIIRWTHLGALDRENLDQQIDLLK